MIVRRSGVLALDINCIVGVKRNRVSRVVERTRRRLLDVER